MNTSKKSPHLSIEKIEAYVDARLSDKSAAVVEQHVSECDQCARLLVTTQKCAILLDQWTAKSHGEVLKAYNAKLVDRMVNGLKEAGELAKSKRNVDWFERLSTWGSASKVRAGAALRIILNVPGEATRIVTEGLESLLQPNPRWQFSYEAGPIRARGTGTGGADLTIVKSEGAPEVEVFVESDAQQVLVRMKGVDQPKMAPLVVLIPMNQDEKPKLPDHISQVGPQACEIIFKDVEPGKYTLVVEPTQLG
jgi:hypothetical protein